MSSLWICGCLSFLLGFPCGSAGKESACNEGDMGSIPGLGRTPREGKGCPLQYSGLENSMDCIVHGVAESDRTERLSLHFSSFLLFHEHFYHLHTSYSSLLLPSFIYFLLLTALLRYNLYTVELTRYKWSIQWFLVNFCNCAIIIIIQVWNTSFAPKSSLVFAYSWFPLLLPASGNHWSAFCLYSFDFSRNFMWMELNCMLSFESGFFRSMRCFWDSSRNAYQWFIPLCCLMVVV